jgi:hypothetical protein
VTSKRALGLWRQSHVPQIEWVKGHSGNEKSDVLAGQQAEKVASSPVVSVTSLKLRISQRYNSAKERWSKNPAHFEKDSIAPPP